MQYIGLKDNKNGKEIYEGDILQIDSEWIGIVKFGQYYTSHGGWGDGMREHDIYHQGFYYDVHEDASPFNVDSEEYEIIGNIYENPELLAGK